MRRIESFLSHIPVVSFFVAWYWRKTGGWPVSCYLDGCCWSGREREWPDHFTLNHSDWAHSCFQAVSS